MSLMVLTPGARLRSSVCATEVVVVKGTPSEVDLRCGGFPMVPIDSTPDTSGSPAVGYAGGTELGKRYSHDGSGLELLCTKPGEGSISVGDQVLTTKQAKPLPSSD
jgi:hypothetical protein